MNGQELLQKMRETYASLESYSDIGMVESPGMVGPAIEFHTYFRRPDNYRFRWLSWHPLYGKKEGAEEHVLWTDGKDYWKNFFNQVEKCESLSQLIAAATGISSGSAYAISDLLFPGSLGFTHIWHHMTDVKPVADTTIGDSKCFLVSGKSGESSDTEVCIEQNSYLVRRLRLIHSVTEEACAAMSALTQSDKYLDIMKAAAKKSGLSDEEIAEEIEALSTLFKPSTLDFTYHYKSVAVNEPIDDKTFTGK